MKKIFYATCIIVLGCVIGSHITALLTTQSAEVSATVSEQQSPDSTYVLTCEGDRIVAFVKGAREPFLETTTAVSSLPRDVQMSIRQGIEYNSLEELYEAVEEYCS